MDNQRWTAAQLESAGNTYSAAAAEVPAGLGPAPTGTLILAQAAVDASPIRVTGVSATFGAGDGVGEMALLDGGRRRATVSAYTPMEVYVLTTSEFRAMIASQPDVHRKITAHPGGAATCRPKLDPEVVMAQFDGATDGTRFA